MLVTVKGLEGETDVFFCDHPLLSRFKGEQARLAMWVTRTKAKALARKVPPSQTTTYDKAWDTEVFFGKRSATRKELYFNLFGDGRYYINALVVDFLRTFGRPHQDSDNVLSTATVLKRCPINWADSD